LFAAFCHSIIDTADLPHVKVILLLVNEQLNREKHLYLPVYLTFFPKFNLGYTVTSFLAAFEAARPDT